MLWSKSIAALLLICSMLLTTMPVSSLPYDEIWWDNSWSFKQEIVIPIDTSKEIAKYQPIDISLEFENPCWAKNENEHSIRVIFQDADLAEEIESQIYNLNHTDDVHIRSCCLVFLIPAEATGKEKYYVYYDDSEKSAPNYVNHVDVTESYYFYEPISGYPFESHFYKITEDGFVVYAVAQEGDFMGHGTSQHVTKLKEKTEEVLPKNSEFSASFAFSCYYNKKITDCSSTSQCLVSKEIRVDGNIMVEVGIASISNRGDVRTTATYKYYYCPASNKRIHAHVKHEVLQECKVAQGSNLDGVYADLRCSCFKSKSIKDLNYGEILPYLHIYNELDMISEYPLDPNPEYIPDDLITWILTTKDDVDLGKCAWASFDEGNEGAFRSIIFGSNSFVKSGTDERDGVQLNTYEMDYPHLPGLESDKAALLFCRNSYEIGGVQDAVIPDDFVVEFDAEVFSAHIGGSNIVKEEADVFQSLVKIKPSNEGGFSECNDKADKHNLTIFVHFASSTPAGSIRSVLSDRAFSHLTAELYKEGSFICSGNLGRLSITSFPELSETDGIKKIVDGLSIFDWKNISFFKKIRFQTLQSGKYLVKIYKENPVFGKERKYIGFTIVDVKEDVKTRVFCKPEGSVHVSAVDQNNKGVKDADVVLIKDGVVISRNITDGNGGSVLKAPCSMLNSYDLIVLYNGFTVYNESVWLRYIRKAVPIKKSLDIEHHNLKLEVLDTWNLPSEINFNPVITSKEMSKPTVIAAEKLTQSNYLFTNLIPASYNLNLQHKSFSLEKNIKVTSEEDIRFIFPAEFNITINTLDSRGSPLEDAKVIISRDGKQVEKQSKESGILLSLPPGTYTIEVYIHDELIGSRSVNVLGERNFDLITTQNPLFPLVITVFIIIFAILSLVLTYIKKDVVYFLKTLSASLAIVSLFSPWWMLHGISSQVETSTKMFLVPLELITTTTTGDVVFGEPAFLPEIFVNVMGFIPIFILVGCILVLVSMYLRKLNKKLYFLSLIFAIVVFATSLLIFSVGMLELAEVGVGSFAGEGTLDITVPGEETHPSIFCSWGPNIGFYLLFVSITILIVFIVFDMLKNSPRRH